MSSRESATELSERESRDLGSCRTTRDLGSCRTTRDLASCGITRDPALFYGVSRKGCHYHVLSPKGEIAFSPGREPWVSGLIESQPLQGRHILCISGGNLLVHGRQPLRMQLLQCPHT